MNLIIGGSGFVGSFLLKELKNHKFINLDKHPSPFFNNETLIGDIRNLEERKIHYNVRVSINKIRAKGIWVTEICLILMLGLCCLGWECLRCKKDK